MAETIFHKIARGEAPAFVIMEDEQHMAFLDIFPTHKGQTIVIPKQWTSSQFSLADPDVLAGTMQFAQKVAALIETKIPEVLRVQIVIEGFEIDYFHLKLFPAYKLPEDAIHHSSAEQADPGELAEMQGKLVESPTSPVPQGA